MEQLTFGEEPPQAAAVTESAGYQIERDLAAAGARCVAGVDEVGRGAWAGPVTVCAVRADLRSVSVAAASVIAKVHRDLFMAGLGPEEFAFA